MRSAADHRSQTRRYCCSASESVGAAPRWTPPLFAALPDGAAVAIGDGGRKHGRHLRRTSHKPWPTCAHPPAVARLVSTQARHRAPAVTAQPLPQVPITCPRLWAQAPQVAAIARELASHASPTASQRIASQRKQCNWQRTHCTWQRRHTAPSSASGVPCAHEAPQRSKARLAPAELPLMHCARPLHTPVCVLPQPNTPRL